ncbi:MAG: hypothetical protein ACJ78Q_00720 [Chloroflexia bacterium]
MASIRSAGKMAAVVAMLTLTGVLGLAGSASAGQVDKKPGGISQPVSGGQPASPLGSVGSGFTYQGRLNVSGSPAAGQYDLVFTLYSAASGSTQVGSPVTVTNQTVSNGLFTVSLDFGAGAFQGQGRWLEMQVRLAGQGAYTTLAPRQPITAAPYAMGLMPGASITGTLTSPILAATNNGNTGSGIYGTSSSAGVQDAGVYGKSTGANSNGVVGESSNGASAYGVWGISSGGQAVRGDSTSGYGVYGFTLGNSAVAGVYGISTNGATGGVGVRGEASGGSNPIGVG